MNIFGFNIPSFEDEFVQSDSERVMENAPASARRGRSRGACSKGDTFHEEEDNFLPGSVDPTESLGV